MRTKAQPDARNFAQMIVHDYFGGKFPHCRGTDAALGDKNPKCFEAVPLNTDKYQQLNDNNPAFFLELERYKGTN